MFSLTVERGQEENTVMWERDWQQKQTLVLRRNDARQQSLLWNTVSLEKLDFSFKHTLQNETRWFAQQKQTASSHEGR